MENRCFACMNKIPANNICTHCGNDNNILEFDQRIQLKPGTLLRDCFQIGFIIDQNGEGITYTAYDITEKKRVRVRELFPDRLCARDKDGAISVKLGCEIQFKSLKDDYSELSKQLIDLKSNNCLLRAKYLFSQNNTLYTVYEDILGVTLTRYLLESAGELSWEDADVLFLPLIHTVKLLNSHGIIHRGISPDTIIVTKNNELKLTGVCTSGVRANNSEIKSELYAGYAAPEQYQKCISYGEWTDVYSVSAVLYKTLTGTMPPSAETRDANTVIITPRQLNSNITKPVSDAITRGLAYNKSERTQYIKDLIGDLYAAPTPEKAIVRPQDEYVEEKNMKHRKKFRLPVWFIVILIAVPIMLGLLLLAYRYVLGPQADTSSDPAVGVNASSLPSSSQAPLSSLPPSSSEPVSSDDVANFSVDDFKEKSYDDIVGSEFYQPMYVFTKKEIYDETVPIGKVISQSVEPNSIVPPQTPIELKVSKGARYVVVPPLVDASGIAITVDEYKTFLADNGIECVIETVDNNVVISGEIDSISLPVGGTIDREVTKSMTIMVEF